MRKGENDIIKSYCSRILTCSVKFKHFRISYCMRDNYNLSLKSQHHRDPVNVTDQYFLI